nr:NADH dehydrogenase subunit 2 [Lirapex sp. ZZ-2022]
MLPLSYVIFMPYGFLFLIMTIFGTFYSLSASHWLAVWIGLEVNLIAFIPLMLYRGTLMETESAIKYFIFQAVGSALLMISSLMMFGPDFIWDLSINSLPMLMQKGTLILLASLLLKLGAFPFHFWFPGVVSGISWFSNLFLFTWQKVAPLFLFFAMLCIWQTNILFLILMAAMGSSLIGGIGGMNQTQLRALLAYSSIAHMGWMIFCSCLSETSMKIYFGIYILITVSILLMVWSTEVNLVFQTFSSFLGKNLIMRFSILLLLLSLGGIPPLLGFIPKWMVLSLGQTTFLFLTLMVLILGSLLSLFYYLTLAFSAFFSSGPILTKNMYLKMKMSKMTNVIFSISIIMNLFGGLFMLMNFYMESFF